MGSPVLCRGCMPVLQVAPPLPALTHDCLADPACLLLLWLPGSACLPVCCRYKGGYWEEREAGQFTGCRDIFGPHVSSEPL